jgi:ABC-2 type transport system ATP-binding protein
VLLTTQYLDEADQLADRIAVIDRGRVIAEGTSGELKASVGSGVLRVRLRSPDRRPDAERAAGALAELSRSGVTVTEFALGQPSLDEVFLALTGRPTSDNHEANREDAA